MNLDRIAGYLTGTIRSIQQDILCCLNGAFSKRWHQVAITNGKNANGYEPLKNDAFRLAHMSETTITDIEALLFELDEIIELQ